MPLATYLDTVTCSRDQDTDVSGHHLPSMTMERPSLQDSTVGPNLLRTLFKPLSEGTQNPALRSRTPQEKEQCFSSKGHSSVCRYKTERRSMSDCRATERPRWAPAPLTLSLSSVSLLLFSCHVVPESLRPHGPQHARPPCPSPSPRACSSSCPLSQ